MLAVEAAPAAGVRGGGAVCMRVLQFCERGANSLSQVWILRHKPRINTGQTHTHTHLPALLVADPGAWLRGVLAPGENRRFKAFDSRPFRLLWPATSLRRLAKDGDGDGEKFSLLMDTPPPPPGVLVAGVLDGFAGGESVSCGAIWAWTF